MRPSTNQAALHSSSPRHQIRFLQHPEQRQQGAQARAPHRPHLNRHPSPGDTPRTPQEGRHTSVRNHSHEVCDSVDRETVQADVGSVTLPSELGHLALPRQIVPQTEVDGTAASSVT